MMKECRRCHNGANRCTVYPICMYIWQRKLLSCNFYMWYYSMCNVIGCSETVNFQNMHCYIPEAPTYLYFHQFCGVYWCGLEWVSEGLIFSGELRWQFGVKILLKVWVWWSTAFKDIFDIEQWMQCSFVYVKNNRVEKWIVYSCSVSVCQIIQHQDMNIDSVDT